VAGFQVEMGGRPSHADRGSDWWAWTHDAANLREKRVYLAWRFGDLVTYWTPINEPLVVTSSGYVNVPAGNFPPGAFSFTGAIAAVRNLVRANEVAYDALKKRDRGRASAPCTT